MISMLYKEDKIYVLSKNSIYKKNEKNRRKVYENDETSSSLDNGSGYGS